jgi:hypothetical protein
MEMETVIQILGTGGLFAVAVSLITAFVQRRKLGAETSQILTTAAGDLVTSVNRSHQRQLKIIRAALEPHEEWDKQMYAEAKRHGWDIAAPPPLSSAIILLEMEEGDH